MEESGFRGAVNRSTADSFATGQLGAMSILNAEPQQRAPKPGKLKWTPAEVRLKSKYRLSFSLPDPAGRNPADPPPDNPPPPSPDPVFCPLNPSPPLLG